MAKKLTDKEIKTRVKILKAIMRQHKKTVTDCMKLLTECYSVADAHNARMALSDYSKAAKQLAKYN